MQIEEAEKILSVNRTDDIEIIRNKWKELVKKYHPDKIGDNESIYSINTAFNLLEKYKENNCSKFKVINDAVINKNADININNNINNIENIINNLINKFKNDYDNKIFDIFKNNYKIINICINSILSKSKNEKETIETIFNSIKAIYKKTGIKFTQKQKYQMISFLLNVYKIDINLNNALNILGIKQIQEKNIDNNKIDEKINLSITNAICSYNDYIAVIEKKEMNIRIKIISKNDSYDKMINLKYLYHTEDMMNIFCLDNKGKTYKLSYV